MRQKLKKQIDLLPHYKYLNQTYRAKSGVIFDIWPCGPAKNPFKITKGKRETTFRGAYPVKFLPNFKEAFSYIYPKTSEILHVCAGSVPKKEGATLDISNKFRPTYLDDAQTMEKVDSEMYSLCMVDIPYNQHRSIGYYNLPMLSRSKVLKQTIRVTKPGGFIAWLDQAYPQPLPGGTKTVAIIGISSSPNPDLRVLSIFKRFEN